MALQEGFVKTLVDATRDWVKNYVDEHGGGGGIEDAPSDGTQYARKDAAWAQILHADTDVREKIPTQASATNQLADKAYVQNITATASANFRGNWDTYRDIPTDEDEYPRDFAISKKPRTNDYLVVIDASGYREEFSIEYIVKDDGMHSFIIDGVYLSYGETKNISGISFTNYLGVLDGLGRAYHLTANVPIKVNGTIIEQGHSILHRSYGQSIGEVAIFASPSRTYNGTWRFKYVGDWDTDGKSGWKIEYQVNEEPFTSAQVAAIDSGITAELVEWIVQQKNASE